MIHEPTSEVANNHPPSMSRNVYNAFYLRGCETVEHSPSYASCLRKIEEVEAGRPMAYCADCNVSIAGKRCAALEMRDEEKLKGVALYYMPSAMYRNQLVTNLIPENELPTTAKQDNRKPYICDDPRAANFKGRYQEYKPKVKAGAKSEPVARPASVTKPAPIEDGYAAAINAAMQEMTAPIKAVEAMIPIESVKDLILMPITMLAGETPLQYARRIAAFKQSQKEAV